MVRACGMQVEHTGHIPPPGVLLVCNHRSYTDIIAVLSRVPCLFLAKAELARWPLFGTAAQRAGTVFIQRDKQVSRQAGRRLMGDIIQTGASVLVFPEGTTTAAPGRAPYRPGAFATACQRRLPVVPIALEYEAPADAWIGDDTFLRHFADRFSRPAMQARLIFGEPMTDTQPARLHARITTWTDAALARLGQTFGDSHEVVPHSAVSPARPVDGRTGAGAPQRRPASGGRHLL
jgi:1-acyl-sn-glycerol-3-phosphate acyltransferase